jgi:hypothetical protein
MRRRWHPFEGVEEVDLALAGASAQQCEGRNHRATTLPHAAFDECAFDLIANDVIEDIAENEDPLTRRRGDVLDARKYRIVPFASVRWDYPAQLDAYGLQGAISQVSEPTHQRTHGRPAL